MAKALRVVRQMIGLSESAESLQGEIARLTAERDAMHTEAARLLSERLATEEFSDVERIDREVAQARWKADRLASKLSALEAQLLDARARERAEALERHRLLRIEAFHRLHAALKEAAELQSVAILADKKAIAECGESLVRTTMPAVVFRGVILEDVVAAWARDMQRALDASAPRPPRKAGPPSSRRSELTHAIVMVGGVPQNVIGGTGGRVGTAPATPVAKPPAPAGLQHAVTLADQTPSYPGPRKAIPRDDAPLAEGEARIVILRDGYELPGGRRGRAGQIARIPVESAQLAGLHGAVEILEPQSLIDSIRGGGRT